MELIERYVQEVGRRLPSRTRADVQAELRSLLSDELEGRAQAEGRSPDETLAADVLKAFGNPTEVAARYQAGSQHLIGPRLYPAFLLTARVILIVLGILAAIGFVASVSFDPPRVLRLASFGDALGMFLKGAFINLSLAVLVFAILERLGVNGEQEKDKEWDPHSLPPLKDDTRISPGAHVASIYVVVALFVLFNFFPHWVGVLFPTQDGIRILPLLSPEFFPRYLFFLNLWWLGAFAMHMALLRHGRWSAETRWAEFLMGIGGMALLYAIIVGPPLIVRSDALVESDAWAALPDAWRRAGRFFIVLNGFLKSFLAVTLVIGLVESVERLYRLLSGRYAATGGISGFFANARTGRR